MTTPTYDSVTRGLLDLKRNPSRARLIGVIDEDRIYFEAGRAWDSRGIEGQLTQRLRPLLAGKLVVLGERREKAGRRLYALTELGKRLNALYRGRGG